MSRPSEARKQERRVLGFFAVLALVIVLTLAHGLYTGELMFDMGDGCIGGDC